MTHSPFFYAILVVVAAVGVVLALGLGTFGREGQAMRYRANRLMQLRILLQAIAVLALVLLAWSRSG